MATVAICLVISNAIFLTGVITGLDAIAKALKDIYWLMKREDKP